MTKPDFEKKAADAILAWVNQEHLEQESVMQEELYPEFVSHLAAVLKNTDANARRETWNRAAKRAANFYVLNDSEKTVLLLIAKVFRAVAEKEQKP